MKMSVKERQELVAAIENGKYKTKSNPGSAIVLIFGVAMLILGLTAAFATRSHAGGLNLAIIPTMFLPMLFPIIIVALVLNINRGADLSKLTPMGRKLILEGDIIEANLDSIEQKSSLYVFHCSADYAGYTYPFVSPAINVEPIPSGERKIPVFINPQNPNQYLINIYSRLPIVSGNVLEDRSELQVDLNFKNPSQASTTALVVVVCVFFVPFGLFGFLGSLVSMLEGELAAIIMGLVPLGIMALAIWGVVSMAKRNKNALSNGCYIPATAQKFWVTHSKNSTTYHLSARYIEPSTKKVHDFQTTGSSSMRNLVGTTVNTFINPDNTKEYYMDVKGALTRLGFTTSRDMGKDI